MGNKFRIVTWNVGGAKFLELPEDTREEFIGKLSNGLRCLAHDYSPDVILLQEVVKFGDAHAPKDLIPEGSVPGYYYDASIAISTVSQSHPQKWDKYLNNDNTAANWPPGTFLAQGYGVLWRKNLKHAPLWEFEGSPGPMVAKEIVRLETGLFTGSRDTEPRLAVVVHFIIDSHDKPLDIFVVNLHLTTLKGEREGSPDKDAAAARVRRQQIDVVANGIVSRYNEWAAEKVKEEKKKDKQFKRMPAVWVIGGDFNCMPLSPEISAMGQMNFIDLSPHKGPGTKGDHVPIVDATITLDYLFAGPAYYSLDPYLAKIATDRNPTPLEPYKVSDHFPVLADVPLPSKEV